MIELRDLLQLFKFLKLRNEHIIQVAEIGKDGMLVDNLIIVNSPTAQMLRSFFYGE